MFHSGVTLSLLWLREFQPWLVRNIHNASRMRIHTLINTILRAVYQETLVSGRQLHFVYSAITSTRMLKDQRGTQAEKHVIFTVSVGMVGLAPGKLKKQDECRNCKHMW